MKRFVIIFIFIFNFFSAILGAENLLKNSSFELGMAGYACPRYQFFSRNPKFLYIEPQIDSKEKLHGSVSVKISNPYKDFTILNTHDIKVIAGERYTISAWMKSNQKNVTIKITPYMAMSYQNRAERIRELSSKRFQLSNKWKRYHYTIKIPTNIPGQIYIWLGFKYPYPLMVKPRNTSGDLWLDALQVNQGRLREYEPQATIEATIIINGKRDLYSPSERLNGQLKIINYSDKSCIVKLKYQLIDDYFKKIVIKKNYNQKCIAEKLTPLSFFFDNRRNGTFIIKGSINGETNNFIPYHFVICPSARANEYRNNVMGIGIDCSLYRGCGLYSQGPTVVGPGISADELFQLYAWQGVRWIRAWDGDSAFGWRRLEEKKGKFNWGPADRYLELANRYKIRVLPVLGGCFFVESKEKRRQAWGGWKQGYFPDWVQKKSEKIICPHRYNRKKGRVTLLPPLKDWKDYIRAVVKRYKGKITHYEIMNEPNLFLKPEQYVRYLKAAYKTAKKADPCCKIVGYCITGDLHRNIIPYLEKCFKRVGNKYVDVLSFHSYDARLESSPVKASYMINGIRSLMDKYNLKNDLWMTELYYLNKTYNDANIAQLFRANALARRYLIDLAAGIAQSIYIPGFRCTRSVILENIIKTHTSPSSLLNKICSVPSDLFVVNNTLSRLFEGAKIQKIITWPYSNICYIFYNEMGLIAAIWNHDENREFIVDIPLSSKKVKIMNLFGNIKKINKKNKISLLMTNDPWYLKCDIKYGNEFIKALQEAEINFD